MHPIGYLLAAQVLGRYVLLRQQAAGSSDRIAHPKALRGDPRGCQCFVFRRHAAARDQEIGSDTGNKSLERDIVGVVLDIANADSLLSYGLRSATQTALLLL